MGGSHHKIMINELELLLNIQIGEIY